MRGLRVLHRYSGLVLALPLFMFALTGAALIYKEKIWRTYYPELAEAFTVQSAAEHAAALQAIGAMFPGTIEKISFPRRELPAYVVRLEGAEALVHPRSRKLIASWRWYESPIGILTELHFRLGAGELGHRIAGAVGLAAGLMVLSGLLLWWPSRSGFRIRHLFSVSTDRPILLRLHRHLGAVASALILLLSLTGAGLVFNSTAKLLLNGLFSSGPPLASAPAIRTPRPIGMPSSATIALAQATFPLAQLISYQPPKRGNAVHSFRFRQPGEMHPNGRSAVYVNGLTGRLVHAVDATRQPTGERMADALYPLHAAKIGGWPYELIAVLGALSLAAMSATGVIAYCRPRRVARTHPGS